MLPVVRSVRLTTRNVLWLLKRMSQSRLKACGERDVEARRASEWCTPVVSRLYQPAQETQVMNETAHVPRVRRRDVNRGGSKWCDVVHVHVERNSSGNVERNEATGPGTALVRCCRDGLYEYGRTAWQTGAGSR